MTDEVYIIAEAGVNHNGSLARALKMVDLASESGANAIKFQTFRADELAAPDTPLAEYQKSATGGPRTQHEMLQSLELGHEDFRRIRDHCDQRKIDFLSTAFDLSGLQFLIDELGIGTVKIASGDLTFAPLLVAAGRSGLPIIVSTGMADLNEVGLALQFIAVGYAIRDGLLAPDARITPVTRDSAWARRNEVRSFDSSVTVLHCTTDYPASLEYLNLRAMTTIGSTFGSRVGYSDHSLGDLASTVAVALGARVIEKHFTLDKTLHGPDHAASLGPDELVRFVAKLRSVETVMGSPLKDCQPVEAGNRNVVRRSLVASRPIELGSIIVEDDLVCRRPAQGRSTFEFWDVVGKPALRSYNTGDHVD